MKVDIEKELLACQNALAAEIAINPDKSWRESILVRYAKLLDARGYRSDTIRPWEEWRPGALELTEAVLRGAGIVHNGAA